MRELASSFKEIWQTDRGLIYQVIFLFLVSVAVAIIGFVIIEPKQLQVLSHYTDLGKINNYSDSKWYFQYVFPTMALVIGLLNGVIVPKIFVKSGGAIAKLFLWLSVVLLFVLLFATIRVIDTNKVLG